MDRFFFWGGGSSRRDERTFSGVRDPLALLGALSNVIGRRGSFSEVRTAVTLRWCRNPLIIRHSFEVGPLPNNTYIIHVSPPDDNLTYNQQSDFFQSGNGAEKKNNIEIRTPIAGLKQQVDGARDFAQYHCR